MSTQMGTSGNLPFLFFFFKFFYPKIPLLLFISTFYVALMLSLIYFTFILDFTLYYLTFKFFNVKRKLNLPFKVKLILFSFFTVVVYFMLEKTYYHFSTYDRRKKTIH